MGPYAPSFSEDGESVWEGVDGFDGGEGKRHGAGKM